MAALKAQFGLRVALAMALVLISVAAAQGRSITPPITQAHKKYMFSNAQTPQNAARRVAGAAVGKVYPYKPRGILFHGGKVIDSGVTVYIIWYGTWSRSQKAVINDFISSLGTSSNSTQQSVRQWYKITGLYYNKNGSYIKPSVKLGASVNDNYSQGKALKSDSTVANIVKQKLKANLLPRDVSGLYLVLTSSDVSKDGFCTEYCGWHDFISTGNGKHTYKYGFIGNAALKCPTSCTTGVNLNGDFGVDAMVSVIGHEISEAVTDPEFTAWYDSEGYENADLCAWQFGTTRTNRNGASYNVVGRSNRLYLIQRNWNPKKGSCTMG